MNEFDIARKLGASSFLVFKTIQQDKHSMKEISLNTGISIRGLRNIIPKLESSNIITRTEDKKNWGMMYVYTINNFTEWKLC